MNGEKRALRVLALLPLVIAARHSLTGEDLEAAIDAALQVTLNADAGEPDNVALDRRAQVDLVKLGNEMADVDAKVGPARDARIQ